jgi:Testicular haploid expressed repeat
LYRDPFCDLLAQVSSAARSANPSERTDQLAAHRLVPAAYLLPRDPQWDVSEAARNAVPTQRLDALAAPIVRIMNQDLLYNPQAYTVSENAKSASASGRVIELAVPVVRW